MKIFGFTFGKSERAREGEFLGKAAVEAGRVDNWGSQLVSGSSGWFGGFLGGVSESFAGAWQRNIVAERECVLAFGAVYACITRIANDIAKLPLVLKEYTDDEIWATVGVSPYWAVLRKPNAWQNRIQFVTQWLLSKLITGNTYVLKERDVRGIVTALYVLDPTKVKILVASDGGVYYQLSKDDLSGLEKDEITVPGTEMIHDRMNPLFHPLVGVSPLYAANLPATQGLHIQRNSSKFFANMSKPGGILSAPGKINDNTIKEIKEYWTNNFTGENAGRIAVIGDGMKYEALAVPAVEAQLVEQLKLTKEDIAGIFGMPLYKIGAGPVPAANNVEALNQQYHSDCLQTHIESIELCLDEGLGLDKVPGKTYGCEFDLDVLLRMDSATQIKTLAEGVGAAIYAPNEARKKMNLAPKRGGNSPMLQQQNYSLEALDKRDSQADPFGTAAPAAPALPAPANDDDAADEAVKGLLTHLTKRVLETVNA